MSDDDTDEELYSISSSQAVYKRSRSRSSPERRTLPKLVVRRPSPDRTVRTEESRSSFYQSDRMIRSEESRPSANYGPVTKWAVDYNNKNYIRSQCNKNVGLHRKLRGRPLDWHVEYDNHYHVRSKVNSPKGLHRLKREVKRKYAPDDDDLADATGWEFDCGPEIDQDEQDVHFIPEGRIVSRGCYRWYGVKRNDSDCDVKQQEHRENLLNEELEAELKYGHEFLQSDIPHMSEQKNKLQKKYSKGGYRFYEVPRNVYDIKPEELATAEKDPEWSRKYHTNGIKYLETDMCEYDLKGSSEVHVSKGKPFKRTILNKVYELKKRVDSRESMARHATRLSLVPGEGEKTLYEGVSDRFPFGAKKKPSLRGIFKKKSERQRYRSREGEEFEEYEREDTEKNYRELSPHYQDRLHKMADERRKSRYIEEDEPRRRSTTRGGLQEYAYGVKAENEPRSRDSRSDSMARESPRDVREEFETWRENAEGTRREWEMDAHRTTSDSKPVESRRRTDAYIDDYMQQNKDDPGSSIPRRASLNSENPTDIREEFETWRDDVENSRQEREMDSYRKKERRPTENRRTGEDNYIPRSESSHRDRREERRKEYGTEEIMSRELKSRPNYENNSSREAVIEKHRSRQEDYEDQESYSRKDLNNRGKRDDNFEEMKPGKDQVLKKLPPHVEKRMRQIEEKMERKFEQVDKRLKGDREGFRKNRSLEDIDLMKHRGHPGDKGHSHNSEYEKYVTKNGSEYWVKKEEKYSELQHKNSR